MHLTLDWRFLCKDYGAGYVYNDHPRYYTWFYKTPKPSKRHKLGCWGMKSSTNLNMLLALHNAMAVHIGFCTHQSKHTS